MSRSGQNEYMVSDIVKQFCCSDVYLLGDSGPCRLVEEGKCVHEKLLKITRHRLLNCGSESSWRGPAGEVLHSCGFAETAELRAVVRDEDAALLHCAVDDADRVQVHECGSDRPRDGDDLDLPELLLRPREPEPAVVSARDLEDVVEREGVLHVAERPEQRAVRGNGIVQGDFRVLAQLHVLGDD